MDPFTDSGSEIQVKELCMLDFETPGTIRRQTSIICSLGRVSRSVEMIEQLILAGARIFRLIFSQDSHEVHADTIENIREACNRAMRKLNEDLHVAIAVDTKGPEIRTGMIGGTRDLDLRRNDILRLSTNKDLMMRGTHEVVYVDYPDIVNSVIPGTRIYVADGTIPLMVKEIAGDFIICQVELPGTLGSNKGVSIPGAYLELPPVSEKDRYDIKFAVENNVDFIFASKVRHPSAIKHIRAVLGEKGKGIQIVAKIDGFQILDHLEEVIHASDGILVDRVNLGIEEPFERVFMLQKSIVARCNRAGKPVAVGAQLLEAMRSKEFPTRAEISDVANAVLDGADALMAASGTAVGKYPVETIKMLDNICTEAEMLVLKRNLFDELVIENPSLNDDAQGIARQAVNTANNTSATCIVVLTTSGRSAHLVSMYRPRCPILAVTRCSRTARQAHLRRSVVPLLYREKPLEDFTQEVDRLVDYALSRGQEMDIVHKGDPVVVLSPGEEDTGFCDNMHVMYAFYDPDHKDENVQKKETDNEDEDEEAANVTLELPTQEST